MPVNYLHNHKQFAELLRILENETGIQAGLIEKDYWIMHVLYGLKQQGYEFELKGGTSLSKGYKIIDRFSEDIDIHIKPPASSNVTENPGKTSKKDIESRKKFYASLALEIKIDGITSIERDHSFDDEKYRSGGIRLLYKSKISRIVGVKEGILLEAGFDNVTPNNNRTISSWALEKALSIPSIEIIDNRAIDVACYHPGYTFVEKLQTIATKYRQEQSTGDIRPNLMRQYYDVYSLLNNRDVQDFIGTEEYKIHKKARFPKTDFDIPIAENEAFLLNTPEVRASFKKRFKDTASLYYNGQPEFDDMLKRIALYIQKL